MDDDVQSALAAVRAVGWSALAEAMTQEERHHAAARLMAPTIRPAVEAFGEAMERAEKRLRREVEGRG